MEAFDYCNTIWYHVSVGSMSELHHRPACTSYLVTFICSFLEFLNISQLDLCNSDISRQVPAMFFVKEDDKQRLSQRLFLQLRNHRSRDSVVRIETRLHARRFGV